MGLSDELIVWYILVVELFYFDKDGPPFLGKR